MISMMRVYKEAGYHGPFSFDHTPHFATDGNGVCPWHSSTLSVFYSA
jgi:hypothetical protein